MLRICVLVSALVVVNSVARADDKASEAPKPWSVGVSAEHKAAAQEHLDKGNSYYVNQKYKEALDEYNLALAEWEHPAIHFNIVQCLAFLDRPLDAVDHLKLALAYGSTPYEPTIYAEVLSYQKLLSAQIGEIDIACAQTGVEIRIDGEPLLACPGKEHRRVLPGNHQIVGKKDGFVPRTVELVVLGGKQKSAAIELDPLSKVARVEHRWKTWIPWTVFGGGFAIAGLGGLLHLKATSDNSAYANVVTTNCPDSCVDSSLDHTLDRSAHIENGVAIGLIAVGAAAVAAGSAMLYVNRGHTVYDLPKESPTPQARLDLVPTRDGAAVTVSGRF
jgi:tetratricopeptide (TPR) repeat protein